MKKIIIICGIMLAIIASVAALKECTRTVNDNNIPCMIISTWNYTNCNSTQANIYNATPSLIQTTNFTRYTSSNCNITWNISNVGSYTWITTNDDSGSINVEVDENMNIAISIALTSFAIFFTAGGIWLIMKNRQPEAENV